MMSSHRRLPWIASLAAAAMLAGLSNLPHALAQDAASTTQPAGKASITVTVTDPENNPVQGARVMLTAAAPPSTDPSAASTGGPGNRPKPLARATTDSSGKATLPDLADGDYTVIARVRGKGNGRAKVTIASGTNADVSITLKAGKRAGAAAAPATQPG